MAREHSRWFEKHPARGSSSLRVFCIPHAGGSGYPYRTWLSHLPEHLELVGVRLPGRGARFAEIAFRRMEPLVAALTEAVAQEIDSPFALFGHSMGALIAFELCARLANRGLNASHLFVSGTRPPHIARSEEKPLHTLPRDEFLEELRKLNGTATELLEDASAVASLLPPLRADFELVETYPTRIRPAVACPLTALGGAGDPTVAPEHLDEWSRYTTQSFSRVLFPGDHFFIMTEQAAVLRTLSHALCAPQAPGAG
jgi:medium-chain acyl-[acyl-carrier-protein] hydrolase